MNVFKQSFQISHVRVSQNVKGVLMFNLRHIIFTRRQIYWQVCISVPLKELLVLFLESGFLFKTLVYTSHKINVSWNIIISHLQEINQISQKKISRKKCHKTYAEHDLENPFMG